MTKHTITQQDLAGVGVIGLADTPGLSTADMQAKLEETARQVIIPHFNAAMADAADTDRVQQMIDEQVVASGAGDMARAVYDPDRAARNIFAPATAAGAGMVLLRDEPDAAADASSGQAVTPAALAAVAQSINGDAMPKSGGTFTGNVAADGVARTGACLRNCEVCDRTTDSPVKSASLIFIRA